MPPSYADRIMTRIRDAAGGPHWQPAWQAQARTRPQARRAWSRSRSPAPGGPGVGSSAPPESDGHWQPSLRQLGPPGRPLRRGCGRRRCGFNRELTGRLPLSGPRPPAAAGAAIQEPEPEPETRTKLNIELEATSSWHCSIQVDGPGRASLAGHWPGGTPRPGDSDRDSLSQAPGTGRSHRQGRGLLYGGGGTRAGGRRVTVRLSGQPGSHGA